MPDDPYVPVGGWEAAGYSGFTPNYALQTINPYATPTYTPTMSAPQQLLNYSSGVQAGPAAQTTSYQPQQLIASPTQQGYGMTGPVMTNQFSTSRGGAGGGTPAIAQPGTVRNTNTAGGYSGLLGGSSGGYSPPQGPTFASFMSDAGFSQQQDDNGQNSWTRNGRGADADVIQQLTQQYNQTYGGPYGDLSGSQPANPYGDLSGSQPSNPYGNLSGVPPMQAPSPYGNLSNSQPQPSPTGGATLGNSAATGGAGLLGGSSTPILAGGGGGVQMPGSSYGGLLGSSMPNPTTTPNPANLPSPNANPVSSGPQAQVPGDNYGFPADDQTYMDMPQGANGQYGSLMGGQDYGEENPWAQSIGSSGSPNPGTVQINTPPAMPINTQPQSPGSPGVQMPGGSPYGALPATVQNTPPAMSLAQFMSNAGISQQQDDYGQNYWARNGHGADQDVVQQLQQQYNSQYGDLSGSRPPAQQDAYLFPTQPLMSPTNVYGDGGYTMQQPGPKPAQQQFQQGMQTQAPSQYQPSFGGMPQFTPMPAAADALKSTDRVPQTGGFVGYTPPALPPVSQPTPYQPSIFEGLLGNNNNYSDDTSHFYYGGFDNK